MTKNSELAIRLFFLLPVPFFSTDCISKYFARYMEITDTKEIALLSNSIREFRYIQLISLIVTVGLFVTSLAFKFYLISPTLHIKWFEIISALILTHAVFGKLGWEIQSWDGDSALEIVNEWWFRSLYSIGIILLFLGLL